MDWIHKQPNQPDALLVLLPLLIVLSTFFFLLLTFLICALIIRKRRGIILRDNDGPVDMSREELIEGDGGFENVEARWLEDADEQTRRTYLQAKEYQVQYPPNSQPTDITLSQFLSIQEKGVSAWSFDPEFETVNALLVHARTEITFLPDPASSSCVQSNLPLPKLNEVYYWEVKMFDLPETTTVAVGLATKPYPPFRLPGLNRYSIAYHSGGDKSHNYPFTSAPFGPTLKEGDVLGVGYRPRNGTVFYTRNGRKMEDAFTGLTRWNLFPTIGADGPCSVHVNLGQSGFVFIEANVKKWGLAPSVGTLAPPPAYGSERGSILLDVGGRVRHQGSSLRDPTRHRSRRARQPTSAGLSSPLLSAALSEPPPLTPPPPITPIEEAHEYYDDDVDDPSAPLLNRTSRSALSAGPSRSNSPAMPSIAGARNPFTNHRHHSSVTRFTNNINSHLSVPGQQLSSTTPTSANHHSELSVQLLPPPDSPMSPNLNPPTPGQRDIHLQAISPGHRRSGSSASATARQQANLRLETSTDEQDYAGSNATTPTGSPALTPREQDRLLPSPSLSRREPPAYSPLDAYTYADGVRIDLPAEVIAAALEGGSVPQSAIGQGRHARPPNDRRRSSRTSRR
ncbi:concanavalin A-like lectin/glucanase domain-containing protein [Crepidotus variabilis]|uniref:Concanavalin A-like lectin/glucanase domain-containing protein n=1 Tax=Crepidotus variabilis TaxID=179855 RepID=A0A9P6JSH9_9AGAR|nr:concanavalin A-like lectin/glucanase domain-containing protein [Crepidotus variabilis]